MSCFLEDRQNYLVITSFHKLGEQFREPHAFVDVTIVTSSSFVTQSTFCIFLRNRSEYVGTYRTSYIVRMNHELISGVWPIAKKQE